MHPRTKKTYSGVKVELSENISIIEPLSYFDLIKLLKNSSLLLTDSGGMQKEAYWLKVPCVTLRDETEWVETVDAGANFLTKTDKQSIFNAFKQASCTSIKLDPALYGNGHAAEIIVDSLTKSH